jgi:predicted enzyme related to lactoylglutathione lyase
MAWFPRHEGVEGTTGGLIQAEGRTPSSSGTLVYLTVPDIDAALARVSSAGGRTVLPRASGNGSVAHFEDSEGNLVALFSEK